MNCIAIYQSCFEHTSNNISSGISEKSLRAPRLPRVLLEGTKTSTSMLCESSRLRFEGPLSTSESCGSDIGGWAKMRNSAGLKSKFWRFK